MGVSSAPSSVMALYSNLMFRSTCALWILLVYTHSAEGTCPRSGSQGDARHCVYVCAERGVCSALPKHSTRA